MYVCIYVCMYVCYMYVYMRTLRCAQMIVCMCVCKYVCMYVKERETRRDREPEKETGMQRERKDRERERENRERVTGGHVCCVGVFLAGFGIDYRALLVCALLMYLRQSLQDVLQGSGGAGGIRGDLRRVPRDLATA